MLKCASFFVMALPKRGFEKTSRSESLKVCGNCRRVRFCLSREDQTLLNKLISWHGAELMRNWLKKGIIKVPVGHHVDLKKTGVVKIILKNPARSAVPKESRCSGLNQPVPCGCHASTHRMVIECLRFF